MVGVRNSLKAENVRLEWVELSEGDVDGTPDDTADTLASSSFLGVEFLGVIFCCLTGLSWMCGAHWMDGDVKVIVLKSFKQCKLLSSEVGLWDCVVY